MTELLNIKEELIEELEAFDPNFRDNYHNLSEAVKAASLETPYILDLYDALREEHDALVAAPDIIKYKELCNRLDAESVLPFDLHNIGTVYLPSDTDMDNVYY